MCSGRGQLLPKMSLRNTVRSYCVICKRDFPCSARLTRHWNSVHTGKRRRFITETKFNKLVPNSKKRCDICNIIFYSDFSKKRHDRWHSKNKLACEVAAEQDEAVAEIVDIAAEKSPEAPAKKSVKSVKKSTKKEKKHNAETTEIVTEKPTEVSAKKESTRKKATVAKENDRKVEKKAEQQYELRINCRGPQAAIASRDVSSTNRLVSAS